MTRFAFTKIVVADLDRCDAFYRGLFGLGRGARVRARIGGREMEEILYPPSEPDGPNLVLMRFDDTPEGVVGAPVVGFLTDDVDGLCARTESAGGTVVGSPHDLVEHGVRVAVLADPEGRWIEVAQRLGVLSPSDRGVA